MLCTVWRAFVGTNPKGPEESLLNLGCLQSLRAIMMANGEADNGQIEQWNGLATVIVICGIFVVSNGWWRWLMIVIHCGIVGIHQKKYAACNSILELLRSTENVVITVRENDPTWPEVSQELHRCPVYYSIVIVFW